MSKCECVGSSSGSSSKIQTAPQLASAQSEGHKSDNTMEKKTAVKPRLNPSTQPPSAQVSCQETEERRQRPGENVEGLNGEECASEEYSINMTRGEQATANPNKELKMKQSPVPTATYDLHHTHKENVGEEESQEEDFEDVEIQAPLDLKIEFLEAIVKKDFRAARELCQIILFYEPNNHEASEFLPMIEKKLEEHEAESSSESEEEDSDEDQEEGDGDNNGENNESDEESSDSSSSSSSSTKDADEENCDKKEENTHKSCPSSHVSP